MPVSRLSVFVVLLMVSASSTSLVVRLLGLEITCILSQSTGCWFVNTCSAKGEILKSACLIALLCSSNLFCKRLPVWPMYDIARDLINHIRFLQGWYWVFRLGQNLSESVSRPVGNTCTKED